MNRVLFFEDEIDADGLIVLGKGDRRFQHIKTVLRAACGDIIRLGVVNSWIGSGRLKKIDTQQLVLQLSGRQSPPEELFPIRLVLGHPRPIVLRRILRDAAAAGPRAIDVCGTELGEKSYFSCSLWHRGEETQALLVQGAEQAGGCRIPCLQRYPSISDWLEKGKNAFGPGSDARIIVLDAAVAGDAAVEGDSVDQAFPSIVDILDSHSFSQELILLVGSERGWTDSERSILQDAGAIFAGMGPRILRTETAVQWALSAAVLRYCVKEPGVLQ